MKVRNPWIDPRVLQVRSAAVQAYLVHHGWKSLSPTQPNFLLFEGPPDGGDSPTVQVPVLEQGRDYSQRVIELITDLALAEGRYAVDVLNDILHQAAAGPAPANGPGALGQAKPATK
jgi:hypothetical protein